MTHNSPLKKNHWCVLGCVAMLATSLVTPGVPQTLRAQAFGDQTSGAQTTDEEDKRKASDLSDRLIRGATNASDEDVMATIVRLMGKASEKLSIELDPGSQIETHDLCGLRTLLPGLTAGTNVARHSSARNGREAESCKELGRAIGEQVELA